MAALDLFTEIATCMTGSFNKVFSLRKNKSDFVPRFVSRSRRATAKHLHQTEVVISSQTGQVVAVFCTQQCQTG